MKKYLLIAAASLLVVTTTSAQDVLKQQGGEQNIEVQFNPFGDEAISTWGLRYRKFTDATTALRANVNLGYKGTSDFMLINVPVDGEDQEIELEMRTGAIHLELQGGIEKHFPGTDRLSPYVAGYGMIGFERSSLINEEPLFDNTTDVAELTTSNGSFTFGVAGAAGVDFYFADDIYLGAELNYTISVKNNFDTVTESDQEGVDDIEDPNGAEFCAEFGTIGAIRLGFLF
ncbi:MAG: hypothetical protein AAGC47_13325 [Bacteroidota bacterium]